MSIQFDFDPTINNDRVNFHLMLTDDHKIIIHFEKLGPYFFIFLSDQLYVM